jgi:predicted dehydrogenase
MLRIGLIGCGNVTLNGHLPAILDCADLAVTAVADPTPERLEAVRLAAELPLERATANWRDLVTWPEIDAVLVATPQRYRPEIAVAAAQAGKHLVCEKPLGLTPAAARRIVVAAREAGVTLATVHNYVFMPVYRQLKEIATDGQIGELEVATLNFLGVEDRPGAAAYSPRWRHFAAEAGGGVLMDMLHIVYLSGWLFDRQPIAVSAAVEKRVADESDVEDFALVRYRFDDGRYAMINMAWGVGPGGVELAGTRGRAIMLTQDHATHPFVAAERILVFGDDGAVDLPIGPAPRHGLVGVWEDFRDAIRDGRPPGATGEAGEAVLGAVVGAYASAALEREVPLPLQPGDPFFEDGALAAARLDLPDGNRVRRAGLFGASSRS